MDGFEKIIGYEDIKMELRRISDALRNRDVYRKLGASSPRGLLLHGEPGVGKTLMATALIAESGRRAFVCRKDMPNGDFVKSIKQTFMEAKEAEPSIVFLDDMDKFSNEDERLRDTEEYVTVQSCIDEMKGSEVFVLATANSVRALPNSLLRAGRFDRIFKIDAPRGEDAIRIIDHYMKQKKLVSGIEAGTVHQLMSSCSCAQLETVINEAGVYAGFERSPEITMKHFIRACLECVYKVPCGVFSHALPDTDLSNGEDRRARVVYHEAGHATVSEVLRPGSVMLISAYSRFEHFGGFTVYRPEKTVLVKDIFTDICGSLAGMAAVEQKFGLSDLGSSADLDQAFRLMWRVVAEDCGFGFGLRSFDFSCNTDSEEIKAKQEQVVSAEIGRLYGKAKEILSANRDLLERIADELNCKGVIIGDDVRRIRKSCRVVPVCI